MNTSADLKTALELVRGLIDTRTFKKERLEDTDVREALAVLARHAAIEGDKRARLEAISTLGKAGEVSVPISKAVRKPLLAALTAPLPQLGDWGAAEDRFYLAKAVATSDANWIPAYAADALGRAEINEKLSRDEWAALAVNRAESLSQVLAWVGHAAADWLGSREDKTEAAYRKLSRICEALASNLAVSETETGAEFGKALMRLITLAGAGQGAEISRLREEAAGAALDLIIQMLRLRFDALFDSDVYRAVGTVRSWWRPARPPDSLDRRTDRIATLAIKALHTLARQDVQDVEARRILQSALGVERVNAAGSRAASGDPSLAPSVSKWLATGATNPVSAAPPKGSALALLAEEELDVALAQLMLAADDPDSSRDAILSIADAIDLFEPTHAGALRRAADRIGLLQQWITTTVSKRGLKIVGGRGEIRAFDRATQESTSPVPSGARVKIVRPGVVRTSDGGTSSIVLRTIVAID